jgi:hypothetical protein
LVDLNGLIARFAHLSPHAKIGRGPQHPTVPVASLAEITERWLRLHPFLKLYSGYVEFLERYSGAQVFDKERNIGIAILGFSGAGNELCGDYCPFAEDEPHIRKDGMYQFALLIFYAGDARTMETYCLVPFGFDATGSRRLGVYQGLFSRETMTTDWRWCCESFAEWLGQVIAIEGRMQAELLGAADRPRE